MATLWPLYQDALARKSLQPDTEQEKAVRVLDTLLATLVTPPRQKGLRSLIRSVRKRRPKGLYLYGPVGRGKTMLMDLFLQQLQAHNITAERWHFHGFMLGLHQNLRALQDQGAALDSRIIQLANQWAARVKVLCFDEFHVTDIADAMIMMPFFTALFERGVIVLATSNWAPELLYSGGLQRQRFLPFIDTLLNHMQVVNVSGDTDYRARKREQAAAWLAPLDAATEERFDLLFREAVGYDPIETHEIHVGSKEQGRSWSLNFASRHVARIDLSSFLDHALGAADFIALAKRYPLLFLDRLTPFSADQGNRAKRFMVMIDVLYDHGTKLVVRADTAASELYPAHGPLAFEFSRTISRLQEMTPAR